MTRQEHDEAAARFRLALDLFAAGEEMKRQQLRRENPKASEEAIEQLLFTWLRERPGAEHGDSAGIPGTWPRTK
jgi:hypothetical protein